VALAGLPVLALTLSRGAWVAAAAAGLAYAFLSLALPRPRRAPTPRRAAPQWIVPALLLAAAVFLFPLLTPMGASLRTRLRETVDPGAPTTRSRVLLWHTALEMAAGRPLTGVGTDAYVAAFPRHRTPDLWRLEWNPSATKAHSELLQVLATQGALGLIAALLVVGFVARAVWRVAKQDDPAARARAAAAGAALAAFAVSGLASFTVAAVGTLAAALAGWAAGAGRPSGSGRAPVRSAARPLAIAAGLATAAVLWVPLVLTPWRASLAAGRGFRLPAGSAGRAAALARAAELAPWDARRASDLGLALLQRAERAPDPGRAWSRLDAARAALERAVRLAPGDVDGRALLAHVRARQAALSGDPGARVRARQALDEALAADSAGARTIELVAEGHRALGRGGAARSLLIRCARLYPDFALPLAEVGLMALEEGRDAAAAETLALAVGRNWHDLPAAEPAARAGLAEALLRLQRPREALAEALRALALDPTRADAARVRDSANALLRAPPRRARRAGAGGAGP
jgi:tetratricopeptide (TPR) repeat protein